jgi:hypothetical protein
MGRISKAVPAGLLPHMVVTAGEPVTSLGPPVAVKIRFNLSLIERTVRR